MDGNSAVSGVTPAAGETAGTARRARILGTVRAMMTDLLKTAPSAADDDTPFVELGANSLTHMEMIRTIERAFGIKLALRQFFADLTSIDTLVSYIDGRLPADPASRPAAMPTAPPTAAGRPATAASPRRPVVPRPAPVPAALPAAAGSAGDLEAIFAEQIRAASEAVHRIVARQLDYLRSAGLPAAPGIGALPPAAAAPDRSVTETVSAAPAAAPDRSHTETVPVAPAEAAQPGKTVPLPPWKVAEIRARGLTDRQRAHLEALTTRYTRRTARSKELTQANRPVLADNRASAGFRLSTKEMLYPLLGVRSQGARIWDIDGNAYVDITMGFGTYLFGHSPDFVVAALHAQLDQGFQIGPQTALAGEVAWLFRELTGMERVAFFNTGTEAVMSALRLARTVTGRPKIALFEGSYHGHFDGTLGAREDAARHRAAPMAPGIIPGAVGELLILDYGDPRSLEVIRAHGDTLAAVLVEPVQSRRPDLQPREFLHDLRRLTGEVGALLVFDEMITGFRIGPGGAQAWFGVAADLATYGKIVGGGLPIGIVAGRAAVMDAVDGGFWSYGDASYPAADTTFFAGTFNKHPLVLAAAKAVLTRLKAEGPALQTALNERTARFADRLNGFFAAEDVPMRLSHFGSQFRLSFSGNMDMLFLHLPEKGVYVWEGRNCFLSTAHTDEDIDHLVGAVAESIEEMRGGGFLPARAGSACRVPTTEAQQQLWLQARLAGDGALAYHVATTVELRGALDAEALRGAVRAVVARHDSLRTVIAGNGDSQRVLPQREAGLPLVDFSGVPAERRDAAVDAWFEAQAAAPFDLAAGPLFRAHLLRLEPARHWLVAAGHHIVIDGWSSSVIIDEIARLYTARCEGRAAELDPPPQFEAFVRWQELERRSESMAGHEAFWLERCADAPPALDLPADRPRPPVKTFRGARHSETLDPALCRALAALGTRQGGTLFMTLLAAYLLWLHRVSGQDDLVVGIPVAGRGLAGAERLVGYCTHLLPIRSRYDGARDVAGHLAVVRDALLDAYDHQDYPFARLLGRLDLRRDPSRLPLVSTVFNLDRPVASPVMAGLEVDWLSRPIRYTAYDFSLNVIEVEDRVTLECDYNVDLFDGETIARLLESFQALLRSMVAAPATPVSALALVGEAERRRLLGSWAQGDGAARPGSLPELLDRQAAQRPAAVAAACAGTTLSYGALAAAAARLAQRLRAHGVRPEDRVGLCVERSLGLLVGLFGILQAGAAYVLLDPAYPPARLAWLAGDAGLRLVVASPGLAETVLPEGVAVLALDDDATLAAAADPVAPGPAVAPEQVAYVIYTSGSTGRPKGVMVSHASACNLARAQAQRFAVDAHSRLLQFAALSFDVASGDILTSVAAGATLVLAARPALLPGPGLVRLLAEQRISHLELPASLLAALPAAALPGLRVLVVGGEVCAPELVGQWSAGRRLFNAYGPTEATVCASIAEAVPGVAARLPIGRPLPGVQAYVLDDRLAPLPVGVAGELYLGGAGLARGYLGQPARTAERFVPDPFGAVPGQRLYRTGDRVRWRPDGTLDFRGRGDDQLKLRGVRIEPGEIAAALASHPAVREAAVALHPGGDGERRLVGYVVAAAEPAPHAAALRGHLLGLLPEPLVPAAYVALPALPRTASGKLDLRALPAPDPADRAGRDDGGDPRSEVERCLAGIWCEILGIERVGVTANFFAIGGHSLSATRVASRIRDRLAVDLPLLTLFERPTIAALAEAVEAAHSAAPAIARAARERRRL